MRTTLALDDELVARAQAFTGLKEKSSLVRGGAQSPHRAGKRAATGAPRRQRAWLEGAAPTTADLGVILVDTSVWVDHLRAGNKTLAALLDAGTVLTHPFVIGELALGNLRRREVVLDALSDLSHASVATDSEVLHFIDRHALFGRGVGYVDAHLLAAVKLTAGAELWTSDRKLHGVARHFGMAITLPRHHGS